MLTKNCLARWTTWIQQFDITWQHIPEATSFLMHCPGIASPIHLEKDNVLIRNHSQAQDPWLHLKKLIIAEQKKYKNLKELITKTPDKRQMIKSYSRFWTRKCGKFMYLMPLDSS